MGNGRYIGMWGVLWGMTGWNAFWGKTWLSWIQELIYMARRIRWGKQTQIICQTEMLMVLFSDNARGVILGLKMTDS